MHRIFITANLDRTTRAGVHMTRKLIAGSIAVVVPKLTTVVWDVYGEMTYLVAMAALFAAIAAVTQAARV